MRALNSNVVFLNLDANKRVNSSTSVDYNFDSVNEFAQSLSTETLKALDEAAAEFNLQLTSDGKAN